MHIFYLDSSDLINVSGKDKKPVEALGFGGLYDSPEAALKPLMRLA